MEQLNGQKDKICLFGGNCSEEKKIRALRERILGGKMLLRLGGQEGYPWGRGIDVRLSDKKEAVI